MTDKPLMKDGINKQSIHNIAEAFSKSMPAFDTKSFIKTANHRLETLELKQRVHHIIEALHQHLPQDFKKSVPVFKKLRKNWNNSTGFTAWPVIDYIGVYGIDHPELALPVLKELTPLFSAEFAIRPFLQNHFDITYQHLQIWCNDDDEHVRRLVSEGSRPRLPWGPRLPFLCRDPEPILPLLNTLKNDPSDYVRRSVANNLNDISKDNANIVIATCLAWQKNASKETQWIIRHATRSLVKSGHPEILHLLGYTTLPKIKVNKLGISNNNLHMGESLDMHFTVSSTAKEDQRLVIDYAIHHVKANGSSSAKVFKLKSLTLPAGKSITLQKKHPFQKITTRQYYSGLHRMELLINGIPEGGIDFSLTV